MGHASRMAALADELVASGDEVMFSSSGEVTRWLRGRGFVCNDLPLVDVEFTEAGSFSARKTLKFYPRLMARLCKQVQREVGNMQRFAPAVVLSDSVASTVIASRLLGIRSVVVLNQLRLISSPRTPPAIAKMLSAASITVGSLFWGFCDEILIPDLPPPYTISERNLLNAGGASARARFIGLLTPRSAAVPAGDETLEAWRGETSRRRVFWQISGPPATRGRFLAKALETAEALREDHLFVITAGNPGGSRDPLPVPGGYLYQWCGFSSAFVDSCDAVVSRAGHVSISDYIQRAKPSILVPIQAQTEQMGNANKAQTLGIAIAMDERDLGPGKIRGALDALRGGSYASRAQEMKRVAEGYDAVGSILGVLEGASRAASSRR